MDNLKGKKKKPKKTTVFDDNDITEDIDSKNIIDDDVINVY